MQLRRLPRTATVGLLLTVLEPLVVRCTHLGEDAGYGHSPWKYAEHKSPVTKSAKETSTDVVPGGGYAYLGKSCLNMSECMSSFVQGLMCTAEGDGIPGNCTCPEYMPLFLEDGGIFKCRRAGALHSGCERVEQCRHNNVYLVCLQGKCVCPEPLKIKQEYKCMPEAKLGDNCSTVDSCFTRYSVCSGGTCACRIHYAMRGGACVYVGNTSWKLIVAYILPCIVGLSLVSVVLLACCSVITQRYQSKIWGEPPAEGRVLSLMAEPSNECTSGAYSGAFISDKPGETAGLGATTESSDYLSKMGARLRLELTTPPQHSEDTAEGCRQRRSNSYPSGSSPPHSSIDMNAELMAKLMASMERRMIGPPGRGPGTVAVVSRGSPPVCFLSPNKEVQTGASGIVAPVGSPVEACSLSPSTIGSLSPRPIIKTARSRSIPALLALDEQQRVRKVVRIGSQEISSTVTYVPYDTEAALQATVEWPTLREEALQERFPNIAALSKASIKDALQAVTAGQKNNKIEPRSERTYLRSPMEESVSGLGGEDLLFGVGMSADFMDTSNPEESFRLPLLKSDDVPLRFPQLAQLDQPAFREGKGS